MMTIIRCYTAESWLETRGWQRGDSTEQWGLESTHRHCNYIVSILDLWGAVTPLSLKRLSQTQKKHWQVTSYAQSVVDVCLCSSLLPVGSALLPTPCLLRVAAHTWFPFTIKAWAFKTRGANHTGAGGPDGSSVLGECLQPWVLVVYPWPGGA